MIINLEINDNNVQDVLAALEYANGTHKDGTDYIIIKKHLEDIIEKADVNYRKMKLRKEEKKININTGLIVNREERVTDIELEQGNV